jgi:phosphatidylglycerophosphatase A
MAIKESSDELNPTVVTGDVPLPETRPARSLKDYVALAIATCGVGYLPLAPGTWGSLLALGIYLGLQTFVFGFVRAWARENSVLLLAPTVIFIAAELVLITIITLMGIWAATRAEKLLGKKDPGKVVIDEVAGQLIALLPILPKLDPGWVSIIVAFVTFRLFDIVKPYPARRLEKLESGLGIMSDDIVAGAYAGVVTAVAIAVAFLVIN